MTPPRFSILIPTRQRPVTLAAALDSVVSQPFGDFEVVVMDNCGSPETAAVVDRFAALSDKVRYHRSDRVLRMKDNWELGLSKCVGDFLFVLGDDDALMPDGMVLADQILRRVDVELLHWEKYGYWWEDALDEAARGRLLVHGGNEIQLMDCKQALADFYQWKVGYAALPCIYSSFVHRDVVRRVKEKTGGVYFAAGSPDMFTGIANAFVTEHAATSRRGLSLAGSSGNSTGSAHYLRSKGEKRRLEYWQDEGVSQAAALHPSLIDSPNIELGVADTQLWAKQLLFPDDRRFQMITIPQLLSAMVGGIGRDPDSYEDTARDIRALARKHGIDPASLADSLALRPPTPRARGIMQGLFDSGRPGQPSLAVNCRQAGISDAAAAARLAQGLLPVVSYAA